MLGWVQHAPFRIRPLVHAAALFLNTRFLPHLDLPTARGLRRRDEVVEMGRAECDCPPRAKVRAADNRP